MENETQQQPSGFKLLDGLASLMDNQFRIPGTNYRFGLDSLLGIVPGAGDIAGLGVSLALFGVMFKKGAGPLVILQMLGNIILDAMVGVIPFVGDIFDFGFKANKRNVDLLKKYYSEDKKRPNTIWSLLFIFALIFLIFIGMIYLIWRFLNLIWSLAAGLF